MTSRTIPPPHQLPRPTTAAVAVTVSGPDQYAEDMTRRLVPPKGGKGAYSGLTRAELDAVIAAMGPPTPDDCTITADGRRIDTKEKMLAHLAEELDKRAKDAATKVTDVHGS
jgi:hypothetical protein